MSSSRQPSEIGEATESPTTSAAPTGPAGPDGEWRRYDARRFDLDAVVGGIELPLSDEPFVACWDEWAERARREGAFAVLSAAMPQMRFPIRAGISTSTDYRAATRRGVDPDRLAGATGLGLEHPEAIWIEVHRGAGCRIPVIRAGRRTEFEALLRALARRNEPVPVAPGQGALAVSGFVNWERIRCLREAWERQPEEERSSATWGEELARIRPQRDLYQDRFILLGPGPYSGVRASELGFGEGRWRELSLVIRCEHECTHYLTRRLFGSMRNHLLDELIADYAGIVAAVGAYRANWFLRFLGIGGAGRAGGDATGLRRFDLYRGDPPFSDDACPLVYDKVRSAAENLEEFDRATWPEGRRSDADRAHAVLALASFRLGELAAPDAPERLDRALDEVRSRVRFRRHRG